ncbi:MAG: arsenate reductase ArsC [Anaerolineales bacterium]|nr:arsenate reductase ArsC [Anaerolineales bacterium]
MPEKTKVLFLCTGNSARSQLGEALLRHRAGDRFEVHSAGLEPKGVNPYTLRVLAELGLDASGQTSKPLSQYLGRVHFGYVIIVCADADEKCPAVFPGMGQRLRWPFEDPAAAEGPDEVRLAKFRAIRDQIDQRLQGWLAELDRAA